MAQADGRRKTGEVTGFFLFLTVLGILLVFLDFTGYVNDSNPQYYRFSYGSWGLLFIFFGGIGMVSS